MRILLACLFLAGVLGCSPVVDASFPQISITRLDIPVPAAPTTARSTVYFQFSFNSGQLGASTKPENQSHIRAVHLEQLSVTAKSGISDLSFIQTLRAVAFVPIDKTTTKKTSRQVEIADYERAGDAALGSTFLVPLPEPVDLLPLLRPSGSEATTIWVSVNLGGQLPTVSWTTDVTMVLSAAASQ